MPSISHSRKQNQIQQTHHSTAGYWKWIYFCTQPSAVFWELNYSSLHFFSQLVVNYLCSFWSPSIWSPLLFQQNYFLIFEPYFFQSNSLQPFYSFVIPCLFSSHLLPVPAIPWSSCATLPPIYRYSFVVSYSFSFPSRSTFFLYSLWHLTERGESLSWQREKQWRHSRHDTPASALL